LQEGFATMLPHVWAYERVSEEMGDFLFMRDYDRYLKHGGHHPPCHEPAKHADELYSSDTYGGSCVRLWNLRGVVGEKSFWEGVSLFLSTHAGKRAVDSHDLMRCFERASFQTLNWWFDQWMYKRGIPLISVVVENDVLTLAVRDTARQWRFDMDVCGGLIVHFTPKQKSVSVPLTSDVLDFNVSQHVPFRLDKTNSRVPRALMLATLASRNVSIQTKSLLFSLLQPDDVLSVYRLEPKWSVRGAFLHAEHRGVAEYAAANDRHPIVKALAVEHCTDSDVLVGLFDSMRSQRTRSNAFLRITNVPFIAKYAARGEEKATWALGNAGAVAELNALPRDTPGLELAYALCKQREPLLELLAQQVARHRVTLSMTDALLRVGAISELRPLFPRYISESVFLLEVEDHDATAPAAAARRASASGSLHATSLIFGALVAAVVLVGLRSAAK
jgi:hypothetical protein